MPTKTRVMETAKSQMHAQRQASAIAAEEAYLGVAPLDPHLIQATLVIPGKHMLPPGLENPVALDDIRRKHKLWITRTQPDVLELRCDNIRRLQQAMKELSGLLYDMQLLGGHPNTLFLAQKPVNASDSAVVRVDVHTRPRVESAKSFTGDTLETATDIYEQLHTGLLPSMNVLSGLGTDLKMRVNFGRLQVRTREKGLGNEMTYANFARMVSGYSVRGGAVLDTRLEDTHLANKVAQRLMDPVSGITDFEMLDVQQRCVLLLQIGDQELMAEIETPSADRVHMSATRMTRTDKLPRLNWTVAAPELLEFDWNLQVDSFDTAATIPAELRDLVAGIVLIPDRAERDEVAALKPPRVAMTKWVGVGKVDETLLKTSILVPVKDTPFIVDISVTQAWSGLRTNADPQTWWGSEVYGRHWDEAMNHVRPGERRKDWGPGLQDIWLGRSADLEERFTEFLEHVLQIQSALQGAESSGTREEKTPQEEEKPEENGVLVVV